MQRLSENRSASFSLVPLLITALLTTGCTSAVNRRQVSPAVTYLIQFPEKRAPTPSADATACLTLLVSQPRAAPGFASSRIAYVQKHYQVDYFAHHRWADTPAHMLGPILTRALASSGLFRSVVASPSPVPTDMRLDSELLRLQQVFEADGSSVQLQLRVVLFDQTHQDVVTNHILSVSEPAPEATPYGGVVAANNAVSRLLPELIGFINKGIHNHDFRCRGNNEAVDKISTTSQ